MTLDQMLATPGFYDVTTPAMNARHQYFCVEVDADGVCYQLNQIIQRDGVLSRDGWAEDIIVLGESQ